MKNHCRSFRANFHQPQLTAIKDSSENIESCLSKRNEVRKVNNFWYEHKYQSMSHYGSDLLKLRQRDRQTDNCRDTLTDKTHF